RLSGRGNLATRLSVLRPVQLQWCHVSVDVETQTHGHFELVPTPLQWCHVSVDVETSPPGCPSFGQSSFNGATSQWTWKLVGDVDQRVPLRASMVPRLSGRGNTLLADIKN